MLSRVFKQSARVAARPFVPLRGMSVTAPVGSIFAPTEEHDAVRQMVRSFAENEIEPQALEHDREEKFNLDLFKRCGELGLLGVTADAEHGGTGMDPTAAVIVHEEMSAADPAFTLSYLAHSMLFVNNLNVNGSEEQKARFLPGACSGELLCGMGMSEPSAGTDVLGMKTTAKEQDGGDWVINGSKMWITNGCRNDTELGDVFLVYARTAEGSGKGKHSLFIVEKDMDGFSLGQRIKDKCGMRASNTAELVLEDVRVPAGNLVGSVGEATLHMMRNLELERVTLAAMALGIARRSVQVMNDYSRERTAFGKKLNAFGQIQRHIGDSYAKYAAARAYTYNVAGNMGLESVGGRIDSDGAKLFATTAAKECADAAIQTLGGYGYCGEYRVEQLWRDAKLLEIGGGTLEAHHKNMAADLARNVDRFE